MRLQPLAWLFILLAGCRTIDGTWGVPPFHEVYPTPSSMESDRGVETFFRPFGSHESLGFGDEATPDRGWHVRLLTPLMDFKSLPAEDRAWILPLFHWKRSIKPAGGRDVDWTLFPFVFGGSDTDEGSYFAVFPLGGRIKGLLAHESADFVLFPLYWHWLTQGRHSTHVLWPFLNFTWGVDWSGWRFWPFYGRQRTFTPAGTLEADRGFILWPFFGRHREQLNIDPTHVFYTLPFYGERINNRVETHAYLWPFFQTYLDKKTGQKTYMGYVIPYRFTDGQFDLWPLFGIRTDTQGTEVAGVVRRHHRHFVLWPIERYQWGADGIDETVRFWLLPLLWHHYYVKGDNFESETEWTLWPLFRYRREGTSTRFDLISPLWFFREDYDRLYSRWFNVFRYRWRPALSGWEILYGAVMYREDRERVENVFSVLGGLLELGTIDGRFAGRLLYLPWRD